MLQIKLSISLSSLPQGSKAEVGAGRLLPTLRHLHLHQAKVSDKEPIRTTKVQINKTGNNDKEFIAKASKTLQRYKTPHIKSVIPKPNQPSWYIKSGYSVYLYNMTKGLSRKN